MRTLNETVIKHGCSKCNFIINTQLFIQNELYSICGWQKDTNNVRLSYTATEGLYINDI